MQLFIAIGVIFMGIIILFYKDLYLEQSKLYNPYNLKPVGNCPVQIEQYLKTGEYVYFRARGTSVSLELFECKEDFDDNPYGTVIFSRALDYGLDYQAGYLTEADAIRMATFWINEYYSLK